MPDKICTKCKNTFPITPEYFYRNKSHKDGLSSRCKECGRQQRQQNREKLRRRQQRYVERNRKEVWDRHYQRKYGITYMRYQQMLKNQDGVCAVCGQPETAKGRGGKIPPLAVDHSHTANRVRGLLCGNCNRAIGIMKDNPGLLKLAAAYLEKHRPKKIRVYCSHYVRGPKGPKATDGDMRLNCKRAVEHGLKLEATFSGVGFYVPGAVDEPIAIAYKEKYLTEQQILEIDCRVISTCQAVLLLIWGEHLSRGMQIEVDYAKAHNIPIFRTDELKNFGKFVEKLCQTNC